MGFPGRWLVEVAAKRPGKLDAGVSFDFNVSQAGDTNQNDESAIPQISEILMALIFLLIGINFYLRKDK